jgi:hypothetical protein
MFGPTTSSAVSAAPLRRQQSMQNNLMQKTMSLLSPGQPSPCPHCPCASRVSGCTTLPPPQHTARTHDFLKWIPPNTRALISANAAEKLGNDRAPGLTSDVTVNGVSSPNARARTNAAAPLYRRVARRILRMKRRSYGQIEQRHPCRVRRRIGVPVTVTLLDRRNRSPRNIAIFAVPAHNRRICHRYIQHRQQMRILLQ